MAGLPPNEENHGKVQEHQAPKRAIQRAIPAPPGYIPDKVLRDMREHYGDPEFYPAISNPELQSGNVQEEMTFPADVPAQTKKHELFPERKPKLVLPAIDTLALENHKEHFWLAMDDGQYQYAIELLAASPLKLTDFLAPNQIAPIIQLNHLCQKLFGKPLGDYCWEKGNPCRIMELFIKIQADEILSPATFHDMTAMRKRFRSAYDAYCEKYGDHFFQDCYRLRSWGHLVNLTLYLDKPVIGYFRNPRNIRFKSYLDTHSYMEHKIILNDGYKQLAIRRLFVREYDSVQNVVHQMFDQENHLEIDFYYAVRTPHVSSVIKYLRRFSASPDLLNIEDMLKDQESLSAIDYLREMSPDLQAAKTWDDMLVAYTTYVCDTLSPEDLYAIAACKDIFKTAITRHQSSVLDTLHEKDTSQHKHAFLRVVTRVLDELSTLGLEDVHDTIDMLKRKNYPFAQISANYGIDDLVKLISDRITPEATCDTIVNIVNLCDHHPKIVAAILSNPNTPHEACRALSDDRAMALEFKRARRQELLDKIGELTTKLESKLDKLHKHAVIHEKIVLLKQCQEFLGRAQFVGTLVDDNLMTWYNTLSFQDQCALHRGTRRYNLWSSDNKTQSTTANALLKYPELSRVALIVAPSPAVAGGKGGAEAKAEEHSPLKIDPNGDSAGDFAQHKM